VFLNSKVSPVSISSPSITNAPALFTPLPSVIETIVYVGVVTAVPVVSSVVKSATFVPDAWSSLIELALNVIEFGVAPNEISIASFKCDIKPAVDVS